jgi:hypothetical protein
MDYMKKKWACAGQQPYGMGPGVMGAQTGPYPGPGMGPMGPMVSPAFEGPGPYGPTGLGPMGMGPTNVAPTQVLPTQVSPTQNFVNTNVFPNVVPHVHPSHTTNVNKHVYTHQHYFPHTESTVNECYSQHVVCRPPMHHKPCCPPRPRPFGF